MVMKDNTAIYVIAITKKLIYLFIGVFLFFIQAVCAGEKETTDNAPVYTIKKFDYSHDAIVVKLSYPEIPGAGRQFRAINQQVKKIIFTIRFTGDATAQSFSDTSSFVQGIKRFIARNDFKGYELYSVSDVIHNDRNVFTVRVANYEMPYGAANGLNTLIYLNFDARTGRRLNINDCFTDLRYQELVRISKTFFIEKMKTEGLLDLLDNKFLESFYLPENFSIAQNGIEFIYQQYEIGPRPLGMPSFTVPHGEIKTFIDKNCPLRSYLYQ